MLYCVEREKGEAGHTTAEEVYAALRTHAGEVFAEDFRPKFGLKTHAHAGELSRSNTQHHATHPQWYDTQKV